MNLRESDGYPQSVWELSPKLWQGLLTLPLRRPMVSNPNGRPAVRPGPRNGVGGVWRPAPNTLFRDFRRNCSDHQPAMNKCGLESSWTLTTPGPPARKG